MLQRLQIKMGVSLWLLYAFQPPSIYKNKVKFIDQVWQLASIPAFRFQIKDTRQPYQIFFYTKNSLEYPYHNLYITYDLKDAVGNLLRTELKNFELFDAKTGKPHGKIWGKIQSQEFVLLESYQFPHVGVYTLKVQHFMRTDNLPGVCAIGIKVSKVN